MNYDDFKGTELKLGMLILEILKRFIEWRFQWPWYDLVKILNRLNKL
jgi:hypothetical protein